MAPPPRSVDLPSPSANRILVAYGSRRTGPAQRSRLANHYRSIRPVKEFETLRPSDVMAMLISLNIKFNFLVAPLLSSLMAPSADSSPDQCSSSFPCQMMRPGQRSISMSSALELTLQPHPPPRPDPRASRDPCLVRRIKQGQLPVMQISLPMRPRWGIVTIISRRPRMILCRRTCS